MTDYGHELAFGSFLTPSSADPATVVGLASPRARPVSGSTQSAGVPSGTALQRSVDALTDSLLSHLSDEERELVEPLARLRILV